MNWAKHRELDQLQKDNKKPEKWGKDELQRQEESAQPREKGIAQGGIWIIYKAQEPMARIKVQSANKQYSLAYILPRFGNPSRLRPGDVIQVVPQPNNTL